MVNESNQKEAQKDFYCNECEILKDSMDMHTRTNGTCKLCWSKKENVKNLRRSRGFKNKQ